jgi:hypothetical protein
MEDTADHRHRVVQTGRKSMTAKLIASFFKHISRRFLFERARLSYKDASALLATSDGKVDDRMLADDEVQVAHGLSRFSLGAYKLRRDTGETDEEFAARKELFARSEDRNFTRTSDPDIMGIASK